MEETENYIKTLKTAKNDMGQTAWTPAPPENTHIVIIPREKWEAAYPVEEKLKPNRLPATCVYYTYLSGLYPKDWVDMRTSKVSIKRLQSFHMVKKGLPDIPYSFIITSDCRIYEGRGWKIKPDVKEKRLSIVDIAFAPVKEIKSDLALILEIMETGMKLVHFGIENDLICSGYYTKKRHVDESATFN